MTTQSGHPLRVDTSFDQRWGRNSDFCIEVCPAIKTAGILAYFSSGCQFDPTDWGRMLAELALTLAGSASEMTCIVSSGALNSTHSLTQP